MINKYRSVFDIIGPVMIGPSSSHTAGAVAIGREGNKLFGGVPKKVTVHYYGSFAQTHRGHGTDYAIAAGILGFEPDDSRVPQAPEIARKEGIDIRFVEEKGDSPINHPNTAVLDMKDDKKRRQLSGCSIGGGTIEIRSLIIDDIEIKSSGLLPMLIYIDHNKKNGSDLPLSEFLQKYAPYIENNSYESSDVYIYEYNLKNYLQDDLIEKLKKKFEPIIILY